MEEQHLQDEKKQEKTGIEEVEREVKKGDVVKKGNGVKGVFRLNLKSKETQNIILAVTLTLAVFVLVAGGMWTSYQKKNYIGEKKAKETTEKFVKDNLLPGGGDFEIKGVTKNG